MARRAIGPALASASPASRYAAPEAALPELAAVSRSPEVLKPTKSNDAPEPDPVPALHEGSKREDASGAASGAVDDAAEQVDAVVVLDADEAEPAERTASLEADPALPVDEEVDERVVVEEAAAEAASPAASAPGARGPGLASGGSGTMK